MSLIESLTLFCIMLALAAMPSTSVALVVTRSATAGLANGIATAVGIVLGDLVFVVLAVLGLAVVAEVLGGIFTVIKILGALYLLWFGFSLFITQANPQFVAPRSGKAGSLVTSLLAGFLLTLGDIKAILFYASLFPLFIDVSQLNAADFLLVVAMTIVSVGGVKVCYAFAANRITALPLAPWLQRLTRKVAGGVMLGAGGYLLVKSS